MNVKSIYTHTGKIFIKKALFRKEILTFKKNKH